MNELPRINVQSTGQNSHSVSTLCGYRYAMFRFNSRVPWVRSSSGTTVIAVASRALSRQGDTASRQRPQHAHPDVAAKTCTPQTRQSTAPETHHRHTHDHHSVSRATPSPEVTELICRLPLPTLSRETIGYSPWRPAAVYGTALCKPAKIALRSC